MNSSREAQFTDYTQARLPWLRRVAYLLCQDWRLLTQATFMVSGGRLAGEGIEAGPAADPTALGVGAYAAPGHRPATS